LGATFLRRSDTARSMMTVNATSEQRAMGIIIGPPLTTKSHID